MNTLVQHSGERPRRRLKLTAAALVLTATAGACGNSQPVTRIDSPQAAELKEAAGQKALSWLIGSKVVTAAEPRPTKPGLYVYSATDGKTKITFGLNQDDGDYSLRIVHDTDGDPATALDTSAVEIALFAGRSDIVRLFDGKEVQKDADELIGVVGDSLDVGGVTHIQAKGVAVAIKPVRLDGVGIVDEGLATYADPSDYRSVRPAVLDKVFESFGLERP